jgi:hypothetical protein
MGFITEECTCAMLWGKTTYTDSLLALVESRNMLGVVQMYWCVFLGPHNAVRQRRTVNSLSVWNLEHAMKATSVFLREPIISADCPVPTEFARLSILADFRLQCNESPDPGGRAVQVLYCSRSIADIVGSKPSSKFFSCVGSSLWDWHITRTEESCCVCVCVCV